MKKTSNEYLIDSVVDPMDLLDLIDLCTAMLVHCLEHLPPTPATFFCTKHLINGSKYMISIKQQHVSTLQELD